MVCIYKNEWTSAESMVTCVFSNIDKKCVIFDVRKLSESFKLEIESKYSPNLILTLDAQSLRLSGEGVDVKLTHGFTDHSDCLLKLLLPAVFSVRQNASLFSLSACINFTEKYFFRITFITGFIVVGALFSRRKFMR
jgi:hypothetical protein